MNTNQSLNGTGQLPDGKQHDLADLSPLRVSSPSPSPSTIKNKMSQNIQQQSNYKVSQMNSQTSDQNPASQTPTPFKLGNRGAMQVQNQGVGRNTELLKSNSAMNP